MMSLLALLVYSVYYYCNNLSRGALGPLKMNMIYIILTFLYSLRLCEKYCYFVYVRARNGHKEVYLAEAQSTQRKNKYFVTVTPTYVLRQ